MTTKGDAQFSFEGCSCMEMMSQMVSQSKGQRGIDEACDEMISMFAEPQGRDNECFEMMSQMMAACCGLQQEDDKIVWEV